MIVPHPERGNLYTVGPDQGLQCEINEKETEHLIKYILC